MGPGISRRAVRGGLRVADGHATQSAADALLASLRVLLPYACRAGHEQAELIHPNVVWERRQRSLPDSS